VNLHFQDPVTETKEISSSLGDIELSIDAPCCAASIDEFREPNAESQKSADAARSETTTGRGRCSAREPFRFSQSHCENDVRSRFGLGMSIVISGGKTGPGMRGISHPLVGPCNT